MIAGLGRVVGQFLDARIKQICAAIFASPAQQATEHPAEPAPAPGSPARMSWACLLKHVFDIELEYCPQCGGCLQIMAAIVDSPVIAYRFSKPQPDGRTELRLTPVDLIDQLAALGKRVGRRRPRGRSGQFAR